MRSTRPPATWPLAVLALVLLLGVVQTAPASSTDNVPPGVEPPGLQRELATRRMMGFDSDPDHVRAMAGRQDVDPYLQIPLTAAEAREVQRRQDVGRRFEALQSAGAPEFAGVFMDNERGGIAVVLATADTPRLRGAIAATLPGDAKVEVRLVQHSWSELKAAEADLIERWQQGPDATGGVRIRAERIQISDNRIIVEVDAAGDLAQQAQALEDATGYGPDLLDVQAGEPAEPAVSRYATSGSLYGGGRIITPDGHGCTGTGASYVNGVNYWLVTAGHCRVGAGNFRQGTAGGAAIGPATGHSNGWFDYSTSYCDCMVIGPIWPKQTNKTLNSANNPQAETSMPTSSLYYQGQVVCMSGASRNGVVCGQITNPSASHQPTGGPVLLDQVLATYDGCEGDSGGPVTVGATWAGIHSSGIGGAYSITAGDGGAVTCHTDAYSSKLTASNLYWYLGMDGMMTWT